MGRMQGQDSNAPEHSTATKWKMFEYQNDSIIMLGSQDTVNQSQPVPFTQILVPPTL